MYIKIEPLKQQYEPYLDDGVTLNQGIVDFRLKLVACKGKGYFEDMSMLLTEAVATAVNMFDRTVKLGEDRRFH